MAEFIKVVALGDACPLPVVKAKKAISELQGAGQVEVLVDNEIAVQNLTKMAQQKCYQYSAEKLEERKYRVLFTLGEAVDAPAEQAPVCVPDARTDTVVAISAAVMGDGNEELGKTLLKAFVFALTQQDKLPKTILFYNGGAALTCEGSAMLEDLKALEAQGVEILTCGTCLNFYGLTEKLAVDNAATTLHKPPQVEQAILEALHTAGNPGRGAHEPTLHAARIVLDTRLALAELFHAPDPSCIVFAANATMALNTVLNGVLHPGDHVITTVCEHNSVLRPLYRLRAQGVEVSFTGVDASARLCYDQWEALLRPTTRALVVTGASNVTGNGTNLVRAADFAHRHGLLFIVDAAQTAGAQPSDVQRLGIDALCFTGHKALLGPQGTGGAYVRPGLQIAPLLVGGSGVHSFDEVHPLQMPTALEAGTLNVHGLAGLCAGVQWLLEQGVENLAAREAALARLFYEQVRTAPGVTVYGDMTMQPRAPIVALNIGQEDSARVADILWEDYGICVRAGAHCAPLMHKALGTAEQGVVRFSFSHFNTEQEVQQAAQAVCALARELLCE